MPDPTFDYWQLTATGLDKLKSQGKKTAFVEVLPFAPVPEIVYVDETGEPRGFKITFRFVGRSITVVLPAAFVYTSGAANMLVDAGGPPLSGEQIRTLIQFLTDVIAGRDLDPQIPRVKVITRAEWNGPWLSAPGVEPVAEWNTELAAYGMASDIEEEEARKLWQLALSSASKSPKSVVVMGMPIGSVYVRPLELDNFALHITSESSMGKTESAEIAMSAFGPARKPRGRLYRTWDLSDQAPIALFRQVGCMPVWFDETAVLGDDTRFSTIIFRLAQGTNRMRADAYGGLTEGSADRWDTCLLSTGEARITISSALSGMQRRVLEIYAPLTDREVHDGILEKVRQAYGWPLRWLVRDPDYSWAHEWQEKLFLDLSDEAQSQQVEVSQAANIATCAAGFAVLCRLAGLDPIPKAAIYRAAHSVYTETLEIAAELGSDVSERGMNAIKAAMQQYPQRFPDPDEAFSVERWGVTFPDGVVGIVSPAALKEIFDRFGGAPDPMPTMRRLREEGQLICDGKHLQGSRAIFVVGKGMVRSRLYLVRT